MIGNSDYRAVPALANPQNDAADMAGALRALGIEVIEGLNLDKLGMDGKIKEFADRLATADAGIFFYAGHGLQVDGNNYLVPVDAQLSTQAALEFEMVRLDLVQRVMESAAHTNVIFLDACRNNPLARNLARAMGTRAAGIKQGLAPAESGVGTLISFSTQPGAVALDGEGRNSPYSQALVKHIREDSEPLGDVLIRVRNDVLRSTARKQVPWEHSALTGRFYFRDAGDAAQQGTQEPAVPAPGPGLSTALLAPPAVNTACTGIVARIGTAKRCARALDVFKDCPACPEMVLVPAGSFSMAGVRTLTLPAFLVGRFEVTFEDWELCVRAGGCASNRSPADEGWGRGRHPVVNVSWYDAREYISWLSRATGHRYRFLSDAEWEYAGRGGTTGPYATGETLTIAQANVLGTRQGSVAVGSYAPNAFGLYDVHGNASEWVQDCWNDTIASVPADGAAVKSGECEYRVIRGGSWAHDLRNAQIDARFKAPAGGRGRFDGFRVARALD